MGAYCCLSNCLRPFSSPFRESFSVTSALVAIPGIEPGPQGYEPSELAVTPYRHLYPERDSNSHVLSDTGFLDRHVYHSTIWAIEQIPRLELGSHPYQGCVITDYTITAFVSLPGIEPRLTPRYGAALPLSYSELFIILTTSCDEITLHLSVISSILFFGIS